MIIPAPESPYLGQDEARLLAWLTAFQRQRPEIDTDLDGQWRECLIRCAVRLDCAGAHLEHRNVSRSTSFEHRVLPVSPNGSVEPTTPRPPADLNRSTLQARTLRYVSGRGVVSSQELNRFGASRQVISILHKRGLLKRVRFGVYSAAPEVEARLGATQ